MKKLSLLFAMIAFLAGNVFAQMSYDFNDGTVGAKIAQTYGDPWTTWSNAPGGSEDGVFADLDGEMTAKFTYGNDQILKLGGYEANHFIVSFDMYLPTGKDGYNNMLHIFNGSGSQWATEVYYNESSNGTMIQAGGVETTFTVPFDTWYNVKYDVDLDNDEATFLIDDVEIVTWQFSLQADGTAGARKMDAIDFFPPTSNAKSIYYIDNVEVELVQNVVTLIDEDFEAYTVGNKIAVESQAAGNDYWTTWSNQPGGSEDGVVAELATATDTTQCGHFTYGNDQVLLLGGYESSYFEASFDMYLPTGKDGYNNMLHVYNASGSQWATEVYYNSSSEGTKIKAGGVETTFTVPFDTWFNVKYQVDLDNDEAAFLIDDVEITTWTFSLQADGTVGIRKMDAFDFFPPTSNAKSNFYIDNVKLLMIGAPSVSHMAIEPDNVEIAIPEDDVDEVEITITNSGTAMGDWYGWIEFGQGGAGTQTTSLLYHNGNADNGIGSSGGPYAREMAIRLPGSAYAASSMGMKITSVKFQVGATYKSADNNYVFRIYGIGPNNQPGEVLAEKTVTSSQLGVLLEATFDEDVYMTGETMWATVGLTQAEGEYPLTMDSGEYGEESDGNWLSTQGGTFEHCYSAGNFGGAWLITVECQGELIPATWATLSADLGSISSGATETVTLMMNTIGLENGDYEAVIYIRTNDEELPEVQIPLLLHAGETGFAEISSNTFNVYPNPTSGVVTVEGENIVAVAIYSAAGQLINVVNSTTVDMSVYGAGVYFFNIIDNANNTSVQRVVVK